MASVGRGGGCAQLRTTHDVSLDSHSAQRSLPSRCRTAAHRLNCSVLDVVTVPIDRFHDMQSSIHSQLSFTKRSRQDARPQFRGDKAWRAQNFTANSQRGRRNAATTPREARLPANPHFQHERPKARAAAGCSPTSLLWARRAPWHSEGCPLLLVLRPSLEWPPSPSAACRRPSFPYRTE